MTIEHLITGLVYLVIGGLGWFFLKRFYKKTSSFGESMDYSTKYQTLKKVSEQKEKEKLNEAKKATFTGLVDYLRDELRIARERRRNGDGS